MKAIVVHQTGGPEVLSYQDQPRPQVGQGQLLVRLEAIGVNFIDTYQRAGLYPLAAPFILGQEGAGEVVEVGQGADGWQVGNRVAFCNVMGAYAEYLAVPAEKAVRIPQGVTSQTAAAAMLQGMTAHYLAYSTYPLKPGDTCLIHAGAGGVGLLLIQLARQLGATVIATAGTPDKRQLAQQAGAQHVLPYEGFAQAVRDLTGGQGVQVVYDGVGQSTFEGSLDSLEVRGMMVLFGQSSGPVPPFNPQILNQKGGLFLTRPSLWHYTRNRQELEWRAGGILEGAATGSLNVRVGATYPLAQADQAHLALQGRQTTGKVLLVP
jgi:NADPH2:quinone reductase